MARLLQQEVQIQAGSEFVGTEFSSLTPTDSDRFGLVTQVFLRMGGESKAWRLRHRWGTGAEDFVDVYTSLDRTTGLFTQTTDTDVVRGGRDIDILLSSGDQFQILTEGATAAMAAKVYVVELTTEELQGLRGR